jgi:hypothetical protein
MKTNILISILILLSMLACGVPVVVTSSVLVVDYSQEGLNSFRDLPTVTAAPEQLDPLPSVGTKNQYIP